MYKLLISTLILSSSVISLADTKSDNLKSIDTIESQRHFYGRFDLGLQEPFTQVGHDALTKSFGIGYNFLDKGVRIEVRAGAEARIDINYSNVGALTGHLSFGGNIYKDFFITENFSLFVGGGITYNFGMFDPILKIMAYGKDQRSWPDAGKLSIYTPRLELGMSYHITENSNVELSLFKKFVMCQEAEKMQKNLLAQMVDEGSTQDEKIYNEIINWGINLGIRFKF